MSMKVDSVVTIKSLKTSLDGEAWAYVDYESHTGYICGDLIGG